MEAGRLLFQEDYTDERRLFMWLLSFGDKAEVLQPEKMRDQIRKCAENMAQKYAKPENGHTLQEKRGTQDEV